MIQQKWSRLSDDPDPVMIPSNDPDRVTMSHDDPDREMIQIQRWRWLEDEDDLKTQKTSNPDDEKIELIQRRRTVLKIVSKEYLPS